MMRTLALLLMGLPLLADPAVAQTYQDLDGPQETVRERRQREAEVRARLADQDVREIVRGYYAKGGFGGAEWLLTYGPVVQTGTSLALAFGNDFMDRERASAAWEVTYATATHSGMHWEVQPFLDGINAPYIQGNFRTFALYGTAGYAFYPTRRLGFGMRGGAGAMLIPLLMEPSYYEERVVQHWGQRAPAHEGIMPMFVGGPTIEYYSKLAHFSVGIDIDAMYVLGFDLGVAGTGYLKYTF